MYRMASDIAVNSNKKTRRPEANFSPSLWGDQFLNHNSEDPQVTEEYSKTIEVLKNEVRSMLTAPGSKMVDTMKLIDTLERLGVSYHFENEIEEKIQQSFDLYRDYDQDADDLDTVALHFRLFRQHGHRISCDIFRKWINGNGELHEGLKNDARGLLSLYEASHLRIHGETMLDDALEFATTNLKSMAPSVESPLRKQVEHALTQPLHFGNRRIEARNFISIYEEEEHKNETMLKLAKLDYNLLQMLHKKELSEVSRWWKELDLISKLRYPRDRLVECFFWAMGVHYEPQYSRARIMLTKSVAMMSIIDDTYDAYGTIEELEVFTEAIERWDIGEIDRLPQYMKALYKAILELYQQFEEELSKEGRSYATNYVIEVLKDAARSYNMEAKWFLQGYLPPFEEYLNIGLATAGSSYLTPSWLLGVESSVKEDFEWLKKKPKILVALQILNRFVDDIASYEVEKEKGQIATGIDCYMKENGVTKDEAMAKFSEIATNAWKDINEECLRPSPYSRDVLMMLFNFARSVDVTYKNYEDGYTKPEKVLKPHIIALFVDPIP